MEIFVVDTLEFPPVWEAMYNPSFNSLEFEEIKGEAGLNGFTTSVKQLHDEIHGGKTQHSTECASMATMPRRSILNDD